MMKDCAYCGHHFIPSHNLEIFGSFLCRELYNSNKRKQLLANQQKFFDELIKEKVIRRLENA